MTAGDVSPPGRSSAQEGVFDCTVVGAGPAGLTAALYLRRFHRKVRVIDTGHSRASYIEQSNNCAGFPQGISGRFLLERMNRHLSRFDGDVLRDTVLSLEQVPDGSFIVNCDRERLQSRSILLCTGSRTARWSYQEL